MNLTNHRAFASLTFAATMTFVVGCDGSDPDANGISTSPTEPTAATSPAGGACQAPAGTYTYALRDTEGGGRIAAYLAACGPQGNPAAMKEEIGATHLLGEGLGPLCEVTSRSTSPDGCTFTYETTCREQRCTTEITFAGDAYTGTVSCREAEDFPPMNCGHRVEGTMKR